MTTALLDINILIALFDHRHSHHELAQRWFNQDRDGKWASCPLTENGFVRIVGQASYPSPVAPLDAIESLRSITTKADHEFWPDSISLLDDHHFVSGRLIASKHITDIYLLALAKAHGGMFVTFDRKIVPALVPEGEQHLFVLS